MSTREDRLLAGKQLFAKVLQSDVKELYERTKAELESRLAADESFAAELPDGTRIGSVKRSKVRKTATVTDEAALLAWVRKHRPDELIESVNPAFVAALKAQAKANGDFPVTPDGEVIPGVEVTDGAPSFLPQADDAQLPLIHARLAELISGGLLELPAAEERQAS